MKQLIYLAILPVALSLGACNVANDKDYENMATDICDCVNKSSEGMSEGMKDAFINGMKKGEDIEKMITDRAMEDPETAMKDAQIMMGLEKDMATCMKDLEKKYNNVYTSETEKEVQQKLIKTMEKGQGCAFTHAIMKLGMQELEKQ